MVVELTKQYKLAWNNNNEIIVNENSNYNIAVGNLQTFEADTQEEIDAKINELSLVTE